MNSCCRDVFVIELQEVFGILILKGLEEVQSS
jgi:hypothetical protein